MELYGLGRLKTAVKDQNLVTSSEFRVQGSEFPSQRSHTLADDARLLTAHNSEHGTLNPELIFLFFIWKGLALNVIDVFTHRLGDYSLEICIST